MSTPTPTYFSYLLRLWQAGDGDQLQWRASLEDPHSGYLRGFASLESLIVFLQQQTQRQSDEDEADAPRHKGYLAT